MISQKLQRKLIKDTLLSSKGKIMTKLCILIEQLDITVMMKTLQKNIIGLTETLG